MFGGFSFAAPQVITNTVSVPDWDGKLPWGKHQSMETWILEVPRPKKEHEFFFHLKMKEKSVYQQFLIIMPKTLKNEGFRPKNMGEIAPK